MRQRGQNGNDEDQLTTLVVIGIVCCAAIAMWSIPVATAGGQSGFASTGAMAALMGVFLAVALKKRPN